MTAATRLVQRRAALAQLVQLAQGGGYAALAGCGLLTARQAGAASSEAPFTATTLQGVLQGLGEMLPAGPSVELSVPDVAENGAVVPVSVFSTLPLTQEILIVVEFNPMPLVVQFKIPAATDPFVATRIKLAASGRVYAVVRADNRLYTTFKETKVTVGGCA